MRSLVLKLLIGTILILQSIILYRQEKPNQNHYAVTVLEKSAISEPHNGAVAAKLKMPDRTIELILKLQGAGVDVDDVLNHALTIREGGKYDNPEQKD